MRLHISRSGFSVVVSDRDFICERREMAAYLTKLNEYFISSVNVIWYEVDSAENGIELFERLNIGKIPTDKLGTCQSLVS